MDILQVKDIADKSPHVIHLVKATINDLAATFDHVKRLRDAFCAIRTVENELVTAYGALSETIRSIMKEDAVLFRKHTEHHQLGIQFAGFVDELCELHHFMVEDMDVCLISRYEEFIELFNSISAESECLSELDNAKDAAFHNYMKLSKRCSRKMLHASLLDVAKHKSTFERATAVHFGQLNKASRIREIAPLLAITAFLNNQSEFVNSLNKVFGDTMKTFSDVALTSFTDQVNTENEMTQKFLDRSIEVGQRPLISFAPEPWNLEKDSIPDELPSKPTPNNQLCSKRGHLLIRNRNNLMWRWVDIFCSTQNGNLMSQFYTDIAASLLVDLNQKGVYAESVDCDDRRNVFQVVSPTEHKTVILQAESEVDRDEWITTLTNIIFDRNSLENRLATASKGHSISPSPRQQSSLPPNQDSDRASAPADRERTTTIPASATRTPCFVSVVPVRLELPSLVGKRLQVADMVQPTSSQVSSDPCRLPFAASLLGALQFPEEDLAPTFDSVELNHLLSYVLSCRSASENRQAPGCALYINDETVWLLGERVQPDPGETAAESMQTYSVLAGVPFSQLHSWLVCSDNPKLACLTARLPLDSGDGNTMVVDPGFAGCSSFVLESETNAKFSEKLLEALLRRLDVLQGEEGAPEKEAILTAIAQLSDAAAVSTQKATEIDSKQANG